MAKKMANKISLQQYAWKYGKHDMERLGLFTEMPYMNGKGYVSPFPKPRPDKGRNIMCEGRKSKNGTQHGYFDDQFRRLFVGEAISRPMKRKMEGEGKKNKSKNVSNLPFMPAGITKWHACPGDHFGTFAGIIEAFGRGRAPKPKYQKEKPNCLTNPGKKGGTGYTDICLSKYPEHVNDPYRPKPKYKEYGKNLGRAIVTVHFPQPYFDKNPFVDETHGPIYVTKNPKPALIAGAKKWIPPNPAKQKGGCQAGMFDKFPVHMSERDRKRDLKLKKEKEALRKKLEQRGKFTPQPMGVKKMFTSSILNQNTDMCVNSTNYKVYEPIYTKHLLNKAY